MRVAGRMRVVRKSSTLPLEHFIEVFVVGCDCCWLLLVVVVVVVVVVGSICFASLFLYSF